MSPRWLAVAMAILLTTVACGRDRQAPRAVDGGAGGAPPRYRKIDVHVHVAPRAVPRLLAMMDAQGIAMVVNLSGGIPGQGLEEQLEAARRTNGRIVVFTTLDWHEPLGEPGWGQRMATTLREAHRLGARGLKISKGLGLGYRDGRGNLIAVDEPELDVVFETAGELGMPVAIHTGDPVAFWSPSTPDNERYEELSVHPEWSFYGLPVPSWEQLFAAYERRIARHPKTIFIGVHFGNAPEHPERVGAMLDRYPNLYVDTAARIPELGRHDPERLRALFEKHADRILFGTDLGVGSHPADLMLGSTGATPPTQADVDRFFSATWRWFETDDRDFPHPTPVQGRWMISGIKLPAATLRKIYGDNAARLLGVGTH